MWKLTSILSHYDEFFFICCTKCKLLNNKQQDHKVKSYVTKPGIRWQYFISSSGRESVYPAWGQPGRPCVPQAIQHGQVGDLYVRQRQCVFCVRPVCVSIGSEL